MKSLTIIFAGSGEFGLPTLRALVKDQVKIALVVTQPDRPAGRGRAMTPTAIAQFAAAQNLPLLKTADINAESLPAADLMIVIAFGQKIAPQVVTHPRLGSINLHASRLPKYRGAAPVNWAIIRGETHTGNSVIRLAQKMDAGAILAQSNFAIEELETAGELHDRLAEDGAELVITTFSHLQAGTSREIPQDDSQATIAPKLSRADAKIDFNKSAGEIANQIRGMFPWPGCRVQLLDDNGAEKARVTLVRGRAVAPDVVGGRMPGVIGASGTISTGVGSVEIIELQPEGGRVMTLSEFRNGRPWKPAMRLLSL